MLVNFAGLCDRVQITRFGAITRLRAIRKRLRIVLIDKPTALTILSYLSMPCEGNVYDNEG